VWKQSHLLKRLTSAIDWNFQEPVGVHLGYWSCFDKPLCDEERVRGGRSGFTIIRGRFWALYYYVGDHVSYKQDNGDSNHSEHNSIILKNQSLLTAYYNVKTQIQFSAKLRYLNQ